MDADRADRVRASISEQYRRTLRQRIDQLGDELHAAIRRMDAIHRQYCLLRREFDQHDQTTVLLKALPDPAITPTERTERPHPSS